MSWVVGAYWKCARLLCKGFQVRAPPRFNQIKESREVGSDCTNLTILLLLHILAVTEREATGSNRRDISVPHLREVGTLARGGKSAREIITSITSIIMSEQKTSERFRVLEVINRELHKN